MKRMLAGNRTNYFFPRSHFLSGNVNSNRGQYTPTQESLSEGNCFKKGSKNRHRFVAMSKKYENLDILFGALNS